MHKIPQIYDLLEKYALHIKAINKTLYIATDNPIRDISPGDIAARMKIVSRRSENNKWDSLQSISEYETRQGRVNQRLVGVCQKTGAVLIPLHKALLKNDSYIAFQELNGSFVPLYRDEQHLSPEGGLYVAPFVLTYIFGDASTKEHAKAKQRTESFRPGIPIPYEHYWGDTITKDSLL